jgi:septum site-determining protein MinD
MEGILNNGKKIVGIVSAKGGVGKTTTAVNIGAVAVNTFKKSVLVVDTNLNSGNLGLNLGLTYHPVSMYDIIKNPLSILHSVHKHKTGLHVIPSSLVSDKRKIDPASLKRKLKSLNNYDLILLDSAPGVGEDARIAIKASDILFLIITPDFPTIGTAIKTIELAKKLKVPVEGVIVNRVKHKKYEITRKEIERVLGLPIISAIPEDAAVYEAAAARMPVVLHKGNSDASVSYKKLSAFIFGKKIQAGNFINRFFNTLLRI